MTSGEVRRAYGLNRRQLDTLIDRGLPHTGGGKGAALVFDAEVVAAWMSANPKRERGEHGDVGEDLKAARLRKTLAEALLKEIEVEEQQGRLLRIADVERLHVTLATAIRTRFEGLPNVAPALEGKPAAEIAAELERQVRSILGELSVL